MIQLVVVDGALYYPGSMGDKFPYGRVGEQQPLLVRYPEGDCDRIKWPNPNREALQTCLFDDRECGVLDDVEVLLPDGTSAWK